jgi:hypothetical protein
MRLKALGSILCAVAALASAVSVAGPGSRASAETRASGALLPPLLQLRDGRGTDRLFRVDPRTLRPVGRPVRTFRREAWIAFSPDGRTMATTSGSEERSRIQFVDLVRWRSLGIARLGRQGTLTVGWLSDDRVVAITEAWGTRHRALVVDAENRKVVARGAFSGLMINSLAVPGGYAAVLAPRRGIGPLRILIVDASGGMRTIVLDGIRVGGVDREPQGLQLFPGVTVDPETGRLYAIAARGLRAAEVEPTSGAVTYHTLDATGTPGASAAKGNIDIWSRQAAWVGDGRFAVTGDRYPAVGERQRPRGPVPFGTRLVDTSDWSMTTLDPRPDLMQVSGDTLLATGTRWFGGRRPPESTGLLAFDGAGRRLFTRFPDRDVTVAATHGRLAYVWVRPARTMHVIDVRDGHTVNRVRRLRHLPFLLTP